MTTIKRFEDIDAWKISKELTVFVYRITNEGQFARDYGLRDQIRHASVSVMSNIAEGFESRTKGLFIDYLGRAKGSAGEVRSQAYVALEAGYISKEQFDNLMDLSTQCSGKIARFIDYLEMDMRKKQG